jgi:uncharacterized protein (DUF58 family)
VICREGWYWVLLLAVVVGLAVLREGNLLFVLSGLLLGPLLVSWRLAAMTLRGLKLGRKTPRGICAGDLLVVTIEVANSRKRVGSWAVVVEEQVCREDDAGDEPPIRPTVFFPYVPAAGSREQSYWGRLPRRGRYRLGPLKVSTRFPFGFFRHTISFDRTDTVTVFPRLGRLKRGWLPRQLEAVEGGQSPQGRPTRMSGEFYGVREWRSDDSLRWIHWRSSARHGELIAQQFEQRRNRDLALLVDLWQPATPDADALEEVERVVSFAATVVAKVCRQGGRTLLVGITGAEPECTAGPTSTAVMEQIMERLAVAQASSEDRLPKLLEVALGRIGPDADVVLVSTRAVDLADPRRFGGAWEDPGGRVIAQRIHRISAAAGELAEYFEPL